MPIANEPHKSEFLAKLAGSSREQDKADERIEQQEALLAEIQLQLDEDLKKKLRTRMEFEVADRADQKKKHKMFHKGGQIESFEADDAMQTVGFATKDGKQNNESTDKTRSHSAASKVAELSTRLREARDADGNRLFEDPEIITELYDPLVREGLYPETFVADRFSSTHQLLKNARKNYKEAIDTAAVEADEEITSIQADLYSKDKKTKLTAMGDNLTLKADNATAAMGRGQTRAERLRSMDRAGAHADTVLGSFFAVAAIGTAGLKFEALGATVEATQTLANGGQDPAAASEPQIDPLTVAALSTMQAVMLGSVVGGAVKLATEANTQNTKLEKHEKALQANLEQKSDPEKKTEQANEAKKKDRLEKQAAALYIGWSHAIDLALKKDNEELAAALNKALNLKRKHKDLAALCLAKVPDAGKVVGQLAKELRQTFESVAPKEEKEVFEKVAKKVDKSFQEAADKLDLKKLLLEDDPFEGLETAGRKAILGIFGLPLADNDDPNDPAMANAPRQALGDEAKDLLGKLQDKKVVAAVEEKIQLEQDLDAEKQFVANAKEMAALEQKLMRVDPASEDIEAAKTIEKLLYELKRRQKLLDFAETLLTGLPGLGSGAVKIASETALEAATVLGGIGPLLKAAGLTVKLSFELVEAAEWAMMWYEFVERLEQSKSAESPMMAAVTGLLKKARREFKYSSIQSALTLAQLAGEATAGAGGLAMLGGLSAPAGAAVAATGKAVAKSAAAGKKITTSVHMEYDEAALQKAWVTTKEAFKKSSNRKLGLKALKENGTMALHAIVWAGKEKQDPIALEVMATFKITEQMLGNDDAEHAKVVTYMMTVLKDRGGLLDPEKKISDWMPRSYELTRVSWLTTKQRAEKMAEPPLHAGKTVAIEKALKALADHPVAANPAPSAASPSTGKKLPTTPAEIQAVEKQIAVVNDLIQALDAYMPIDAVGSPHEEMLTVVHQYATMAEALRVQLLTSKEESRGAATGQTP